ncbi:hypothetical protein Taro_014436 [Colocasia esculenta]|uniref:Protein EXECUTER 1, chloroplastic n=1 Tax=Colocasia esculenta TaxID=4460 RepID=A0A843UEW6_COLES|nr:hypothetical protein [Colocasia esculenta]
MASIAASRWMSPSTSHTDLNPNMLRAKSPRLLAAPPRRSFPPPKRDAGLGRRPADSLLCRCRLGGDARSDETPPGGGRRWDDVLQNAVRTAVKRWDEYVKSLVGPSGKGESEGAVAEEGTRKGRLREEAGSVYQKRGGDWDWERWKRHFQEMEEQERIVSILKSNLAEAINREDYEDAAKLKIAIAAAAANDTVGRANSLLNKAVEEERYQDAAFIRDHAGTGLVGWWAGRSEDSADPYGRIIHITAQHGRYVAKSYTSRIPLHNPLVRIRVCGSHEDEMLGQLANTKSGSPLFEIYFTMNEVGEYKKQAVYLKRKSGNPAESSRKITKPPSVGNLNTSNGPTEGHDDLSIISSEDDNDEGDDDSDMADGLAGIQNILQDMIPGVKVKVLKVVSPGKVDRDLISKVIEEIIEDEDDETDIELESLGTDDDIKTESDIEEIDMDAGNVTDNSAAGKSEMSVKFVIGGTMQRMPSYMSPKDLVRVPAHLEKRGLSSFLFSVKPDDGQQELSGKGYSSPQKASSPLAQRSPDLIIADLAKALISRNKIPLKVLKDVGELINLTINQDQNHQPLYGRTLFHRIEIPASSDPLSGLYVSAQGMFHSEVLQLRRKFGQWKDDDIASKYSNLEFYEYVEALKLTGDLSVPAGQVAFRAKISKQYQLPHKGIIPEEFGVIGRYKGQGRLADPGFQNPRWVDGELVILDSKYIRGGPVIGFVYWAPEYHFLVFFNRLRLQN